MTGRIPAMTGKRISVFIYLVILFPVFLHPVLSREAEPPAIWSQADPYYGASQMRTARQALMHAVGGQPMWHLDSERLELLSGKEGPLLSWEAEGWYGGYINRLWVRTEQEYDFDEDSFENSELQVLWSRAISPFFDVQGGVRHDFSSSAGRTSGVLALQGTLPFFIEFGSALFIAGDNVFARTELGYELFLTQRLVMQPEIELDFASRDIPEDGTGSGLATVEAGVRLRYEVRREFAPYIGISWERDAGRTADYTRDAGRNPSGLFFVAGLKMWF